MTSRSDEWPPRLISWRWMASLLVIVLFFVLLVAVALHVQRTAELALAQSQRELSEMAQRSVEVELATERLLNEQERRERTRSTGDASRSAPVLVWLIPAAPEHSHAHGAVRWDPAGQRGRLLADGLPALPEPHEYELRVDGRAVSGTRFVCPEGGAVGHRWEGGGEAARIEGAAIELLLRRKPPGGASTETVVLRSP